MRTRRNGNRACGFPWLAVCLVLLCGNALAQGQGALIEGGLSAHAIELASQDTVDVYENEDLKVFIMSDGGELRQGPMRIAGPGLVVWLDKKESLKPGLRAAVVRVYAEGAGKPGEEPTVPVHLVEGRTVRKCAQLYLHLRSDIGVAWTCRTRPVKQPEALLLYARAQEVTRGVNVNFVKDKLPDVQVREVAEQVMRMLVADEVQMFFDEKLGKVTGVYLGDVRGGYRNVDLRSDVAVIWVDQKAKTFELYARGNVILSRSPGAAVEAPADEKSPSKSLLAFETMRADVLYINPGQARGLAERAEARINLAEPEETKGLAPFQPQEQGVDGSTAPALYSASETMEDMVVVRGRELYMLDSKNLYMREGSYTTCPFGHPHYEVTGQRVHITQEDPHLFLTAWDVDLKAGRDEGSIIGLPSFSADMGKREGFFLRSFAIGSDKYLGMFMKTSWRLTHLNLEADWIENWILNLDYYGSHGPGIGTELDYSFSTEGGVKHLGSVKGYLVSDSANEDEDDRPLTTSSRGRLWWQHRAQWDPEWRTDVELYWLSDVGFLDDYFRDEFEQGKPPESYVFTRYRKDNVWAGLLLRKQINTFMSDVNELPSAELQWIGVPLGRLVYDATAVAGMYDLQVSDLIPINDPPGLWRVHTDHRLSLPFDIGVVRVDPFVRALGTYASRTIGDIAAGGDWGGAQSVLGFGGGVRASTTFSKSYNVVNETLDINRLRHVVTPYTEVDLLGVSTGSEEFIPFGGFDPWPFEGRGPRAREDRIWALDNHMVWKTGLRQRLQTKRLRSGEMKTVDWFELDVAGVMRSDDSVLLVDDDNYLEADMTWRLSENLSLHSLNDRISFGDIPSYWNLGMALDLPPHTFLQLDYYSVTDISSSLQASLYRRLSDHYALVVEETYELQAAGQDSGSMETLIMLRRYFHKWMLDLGIDYDAYGQKGFSIVLNFGPLRSGFWRQYRRQAD